MPPAKPQQRERPQFVIDESADDVVATRLRTLERRINENPDEFRNALMSLGDLATQNTIEISERDQREATLMREPEEMITEFFTQRYDLEMSFDDATEKALTDDPTHTVIREVMRSKKSEYVRKGVMGSFNRPNEEVIPARDKLRQYRLYFYMGRVASSKASRASAGAPKGKLRSTG